MPEKPTDPPRTPDVRTIRYLVRLMQRYDLTAIDVVEGQTQIRLRRRRESTSTTHATSAGGPNPPAPMPHLSGRHDQESPQTSASTGVFIESPMVGTFYSSSAPDAAPFVTLGSPVRPGTIVCVLEAMKVFTDIPAGVAGTITEIMVKNGQSVEFGQPLFRVEPA
jgi:acetyl-CoA carboxylase biotin carboxyl carrier protein